MKNKIILAPIEAKKEFNKEDSIDMTDILKQLQKGKNSKSIMMKEKKIILDPINRKQKDSKIVIDADCSNERPDTLTKKENKRKTKYKLKPIKKNQNKIIKTKKSKIEIDAGEGGYDIKKLEQDLKELNHLRNSISFDNYIKKEMSKIKEELESSKNTKLNEENQKLMEKVKQDDYDFSDFVFTNKIKNNGENITNSNNLTRNLVKN